MNYKLIALGSRFNTYGYFEHFYIQPTNTPNTNAPGISKTQDLVNRIQNAQNNSFDKIDSTLRINTKENCDIFPNGVGTILNELVTLKTTGLNNLNNQEETSKKRNQVIAYVIKALLLGAIDADEDQFAALLETLLNFETLWADNTEFGELFRRSGPTSPDTYKLHAGLNRIFPPNDPTQGIQGLKKTIPQPKFLSTAHFHPKERTLTLNIKQLKKKRKSKLKPLTKSTPSPKTDTPPYTPILKMLHFLHTLMGQNPDYPLGFFTYLVKSFSKLTTMLGKKETNLNQLVPYTLDLLDKMLPYLADWQIEMLYQNGGTSVNQSQELKPQKPKKRRSFFSRSNTRISRSLYEVKRKLRSTFLKKVNRTANQDLKDGMQFLQAFQTLLLQDKGDHNQINEAKEIVRKVQETWGDGGNYFWPTHMMHHAFRLTHSLIPEHHTSYELPVTLTCMAKYYFSRGFANHPVTNLDTYLDNTQTTPLQKTALYFLANTINVSIIHIINHHQRPSRVGEEKDREQYLFGMGVSATDFFGIDRSQARLSLTAFKTVNSLLDGIYPRFKSHLPQIATEIDKLKIDKNSTTQFLREWQSAGLIKSWLEKTQLKERYDRTNDTN